MSLVQTAQNQMSSLLSPSSAPQSISVADSGQRFDCQLASLDKIGCAFDSFTLESDRLVNANMQELRDVADKLAQRVNYLLEPIKPIEVDAQQCVVQMRSSPPDKRDTRTSYYELLVKQGGQLSLVRYVAEPGQPRTIIPAEVTRQVFWRLVEDFSAVA